MLRTAFIVAFAIAAAAMNAVQEAPPPAGAITGLIVDERGEPVAGADVTLMRFEIDGFDRRLAAVREPGATVGVTTGRTNLDGTYRLTRVPPGDYVVAAAANRDQVFENVRNPALRGPATVRVPIYFPGTPSPGAATPITVLPGETRSGVTIALFPSPASSIEGMVTNPLGDVQGLLIGLEPVERGVPQAENNWSEVREDGRFRFLGVPPGDYVVKAMVPDTPSTVAGERPRKVARLWGQTDVTVNGFNVGNVVVTLGPPLTLRGRVVLTSDSPVPDETTITLALLPTDPSALTMEPALTSARPGPFAITGMPPGIYSLLGWPTTQSGPTRWRLESAMVMGRDALDFPLELRPGQDITDAVLTYTDKTQDVSGVLRDDHGAPVVRQTVLVFSADRAYWRRNARRTRATKTSSDGGFIVTGLPPGDYFIAVIKDIDRDLAADAAKLEQIAALAVPFHLDSGEKKVQDFSLKQSAD